MYDYKAPLRDIHFSAFELLDYEAHYRKLPGAEDLNHELASAILEQGARFAEDVLAPLNASGDEQGAQWQDGEVTTPKGFKEAFKQFAEDGWVGLGCGEEYGG